MNDALHIHLQRDRHWKRVYNTIVRGTAFLDGDLVSNKELVRLVAERHSTDELRDLLRALNGSYAVICSTDDGLAIAADHVRTWPLYYAVDGADVYVGDTPEWVHREATTRGYDPLAATEYLFTCYVTGRDTLSRDVKQVQAGEVVSFDLSAATASISRSRYYTFEPSHTSASPDFETLDRVLVDAFERLLEYADGRTILLGLSAGYDSRLIALMLARLGYDDVVTFTYDMTRSPDDISAAASLSEDLGFEHVPLRFSHAAFRDLYASDEWEAIHRSVGFLGELPDLKRIAALQRIRESGIVPDDAVVVTGDLPIGAGTFLPDELRSSRVVSRDEFLETMWNSHYKRWSLDRLGPEFQEFLHGRLLERLPQRLYADGEVESIRRAIAGMTTWYWQERSPKYLISAPSIDYVGYDRWLPLWDREYVAFWSETNFDELIGKRAHHQYVDRLDAEIRGSDATSAGAKQRIQDAAWELCRQMVFALPEPIRNMIVRGYQAYKNWRRGAAYPTDPRYGVVSQSEFEQFHLPSTHHPKSFQFLLLYKDGFFDLAAESELDQALPCPRR